MIESIQNKQIKEWKKLHRKKYRDQTSTFLVEGWHLVEEVMDSQWSVLTLIVEESVTFPEEWSHVDVTYVAEKVFNELSQTETPQGIMAVVKQKHIDDTHNFKKILLVDAVQDPGNVGTIIRSALAFNLDAVVLGKGTVDLYHDKVIRATQGAMFQIPVLRSDLDEWMSHCRENHISIFGTALDDQAKPLDAISAPKQFAVLVGNEGSGVDSQLLTQADETIFIPISERSESLNVGVATSIVLYHFTRKT